MYGIIHKALVDILLEHENGKQLLHEIEEELDLDVSISDQLYSYDDDDSQRFLQLVCKKLDLKEEDVVRRAGKLTASLYMEFADGNVMEVLGDDLYTMLANLDSFHENLSAAFEGMKAPSLRPEPSKNPKRMILHYYSQRKGLIPFVMGLLEEIAAVQFEIDVAIKVVSDTPGHAVFQITTDDERGLIPPDDDDELKQARGETQLDANTVHTLFPWHFSFDENLRLKSVGPYLAKRLRKNCLGVPLKDFCRVLRPVNVPMTFKEFSHRAGTPYIISIAEDLTKLKDGKKATCKSNSGSVTPNSICSTRSSVDSDISHRSFKDISTLVSRVSIIQLHGEAILLGDEKTMFFAGTPLASNVGQLSYFGISLDELPVHSHAREIAFSSLTQSVIADRASEAAEQLQKREEQMEAAQKKKQLTSNLLHRILPKQVADSLLRDEEPPSETFEHATILFSDIVGFTSIASHTAPDEVMNMLNRLFSHFDALCEQHGVYKVETIGDAYMVVAGAPDRCRDHADRCSRMAIDMVNAALQVQSPLDGEPLKIRVGMHSGPVMAGVVGDTRPRYCLFGDTVNVASRMESTGLPGAIQMSYRVVRSLRDPALYDIIERGRVQVKGKGIMKTFLLLGNLYSGLPPLYPRIDDSNKECDVWQEVVEARAKNPVTVPGMINPVSPAGMAVTGLAQAMPMGSSVMATSAGVVPGIIPGNVAGMMPGVAPVVGSLASSLAPTSSMAGCPFGSGSNNTRPSVNPTASEAQFIKDEATKREVPDINEETVGETKRRSTEIEI